MSQIYKIALTGGPCAGKSSAIAFLKQELERAGAEVLYLEETATALMNSGKTPGNTGSYEFHSLLFKTQLEGERQLQIKAEQSTAEKCVILCDRGLMDSRAYVTDDEFLSYAKEHGFSENRILCEYDAVFHLVTAAKGAEEYYQTDNNSARREDIEAARALDDRLLSVWTGTPHLRVIDNSTDFDGKLRRLLDETLAVVGIPEPLEIERKYLIVYPDLQLLNSLPACRRVPLSQTYLKTDTEGKFRVRKRGEGEDAVFIKTVKKKISEIRRVETEERISESEYKEYISNKENCKGTIAKDRYCIVWKNQYFELDVFPFWDKLALLEIELLDENQPFELPDFVIPLREVTFEKQFRNKALAETYKDYFEIKDGDTVADA